MSGVKSPLLAYHTLANGLRCVVCSVLSSVEYCGLAINAGSRDDFQGMEGLAHFVEHTIFKGTDHRRAWHILNRMESVGGELNAYTTKELTMLYSVFPKGHLQRAAELISDLVAYSRFPASELAKEREVVADEISTYLDMPGDAVFDDYEDLIFAGTPLGHNILGNPDSLMRFSSEECRDYISRFYVPGNMVFFYQGPEDAGRVLKCVERYFGMLDHPVPELHREVPSVRPPFDVVREISSHQSHCVTGVRIPGIYSPYRHIISLFTNMLGGPGMNSLLNVALREKRGLVYSVEASTQTFTDSGVFTVYFGCDEDDISRCRKLVDDVVNKLVHSGISERAFGAAKRQYVGQLTVGSDSPEQTALGAAKAVLYYGSALSIAEMSKRIMSVSFAEFRNAVMDIFSVPFSTLVMH